MRFLAGLMIGLLFGLIAGMLFVAPSAREVEILRAAADQEENLRSKSGGA